MSRCRASRTSRATGPALVVSNHPTGIADGIVLYGALAKVRPDLFFFANADAIRVLPQLDELIAPVEWRPEKRSHKQNRETMAYARKAFEAGRLGVLFPSGRLAKRRWWSLHERPVDGLGRDDGAQVQPAGGAAAHHARATRRCSTSSTASTRRCATSPCSTRC